MRYKDYIDSAEWARLRLRIIALVGECCEFCGSERGNWNALQVHHLNYDRLGKEQLSDLLVLCQSCHEELHDFPKRRQEIVRFVAARRGTGHQRFPEVLMDGVEEVAP